MVKTFNNDEPLPINFVDVEFDHPVYILFSSGTTGIPKCIVHGAGGTLLQHKKELILHCDLSNKDKLFYYTTCGWMMWNWMVSTLSTGASLVTFDGSPGFPTMEALWHLIESEKITVFGTSPKYIQACMNKDIHPQNNHNLESLRTILSTGAPLLPEHYSWVYQNVKSNLHLASISGGTDIISCFMLGNPVLPVRLGEIQCAGLGMAVEAWNNPGKNLQGTKAELVCTRPFASMPIGFWNDKENKKYSAAYFEHFTSHTVWRHGDFIEATPNGGFIIHGRSDSTLNPGGVRIGTAEIYRQVENLIEIEDSLAVGKPVNGDVEIILFVKLAEGSMLDQDLINKIKSEIKTNLTPRHVPAKIIAIDGIPYTRSGKKVETAILKILQGESVPNLSAIANSEVLQQYNKISQTL
ncbi:MAG: acetoacetate--CoA ligase [Bdellovibrionota bacterium]